MAGTTAKTSTPRKASTTTTTAKKAAGAAKTTSGARKTSATKTTASGKASGTGGTMARTSIPVATDAPAATRVDDRAPDSMPIAATMPEVPVDHDELTKVARQIVKKSRRWGTGREQADRLAKAGYNVEAVRREVVRLRSLPENQA